MQAVFVRLLRRNDFFQKRVQAAEVVRVKKLSEFFLAFWPVHCVIGSSPGSFHYLEICGPSIYIYVLTMGKRLRGPFADWQKEGADCVRMIEGEQPKRVVGAQNALGQRSL